MSETVLFTADGPIARITLNRPQVLNALGEDMVDRLLAAFERVANDPAIRVVMLSGAGAGFMAGGDIKSFQHMMDDPPAAKRDAFERRIHRVHPVIVMMRRLPKPIIASVHGAVAGIGMSLLMACDLALAAEDAIFTLAYCRLGTSPDGGSTFFLPRHVGAKKAMEITLLGDRMDAATALGLGLINAVVPVAELGARTEALARRLAAGPAQAYATAKRLLNQSAATTLETQLQAEAEGFAGCAATADFAEGVAAFLEKRPARFGQE